MAKITVMKLEDWVKADVNKIRERWAKGRRRQRKRRR